MKNLYYKILHFIFFLVFCLTSNFCYSQLTEQWLHRYTGPESSTDTPSDIYIDAAGDFYMTGKSILSGGFSDVITVKFKADGTRQWIANYNGTGNQNDAGNSVVRDNSGNTYITGYARVSGGQNDLIIIKYNSAGIEQWVKTYNGTGNFDDNGIKILFDGQNAIYTAGYSFGSGTGYDFILLKYDLSGAFIWGKRWNGVSNSDDYLKSAAITADGNIVLAGHSYKTGESNNYAVIKYNSAGDFLWEKFYNGPISADDQITDLETDNAGNLFLCGKSEGGVGAGYDYAVVKLNSNGDQQWVYRYNGVSQSDDVATGISLDAGGNVFITGFSYSASAYYDFATIKLNPSGTQQWVRLYNGNQNYFDKAVGIKADINGDAAVTGNSIRLSDGTSDVVTVKYSSAGDVLWIKQYNGPGDLDDIPTGIDADAKGNFFVTAQSYSYFFSLCGTSDYLSIKYTPEGNSVFETRYDGQGSGPDESVAFDTDASGNLYVTGLSFQTFSELDYAVIKYNPSGVPLWVSRYDSEGFNDIPSGIEADDAGNTYIAGSSESNSGFDISVIKYNTDGFLQWERKTNGSAGGDDYSTGITRDASGNIIVTGHLLQSGSGYDITTIKYNSAGVQQWIRYYNGPANGNDYSKKITSDDLGNVYVTGKSPGTGTGDDIVIIKYSSSGNQVWAVRYNNTSANSGDIPEDITIDKSENLYVCGKTNTVVNGYDMLLLKYNSSGVKLWERTQNGSASSDDEASALSVDSEGNAVISGSLNNIITGKDMTILKYDMNGNLIWNRSINGTSNAEDHAVDSKIDGAGFIYVTGYCTDNISGLNFCTIKYSDSGMKVWEKKYNYSDNDSDKAAAVLVDNSGSIFVTGSSKGLGGGLDFVTMKYLQSFTLDLKLLIEGYYNGVSNINTEDTIKVYLRNGSSPYNISDSSLSVSDVNGNCIFYFDNIQNGQNYYIVVDHRNSLETWSSSALQFTASGLIYDFTNAFTKAYGNNLTLQGSRYCVYTGDANKDNVIDVSDLGLIDNAGFNFKSGYVTEDVNGDGVVDLTDLGITDNNSGNFISTIRP
ncbi:MAG TPA: SBBP repeat-containing protein [Ignavibacteria bacterium]|nr:hypothetical protein [Bacteroidota bacterium]HRI85673.1 SBBP repeat-containing protein [Ignavibacteria bacterium]HRJ98230.1 SBBP repeat-containing protein [Ignavibacteria bacterium]